MELDQDMDASVLNIKCVSVRSWLCNKQDLSNI